MKYVTPVFSDSDPLVCHQLVLRPSLWAVFYNLIEALSQPYSWAQLDPSAATPAEAAAEILKASDNSIFAGCIMIGQIIELGTATAPAWLLRCDGAEYANVDYPDLAAVINAGFVVDEDHFRVPDRNQRVGVDGFTVASQGGEASHTQTISELVSHRHSQDQFGTAASVVLGTEPGFEIAPEAGYTGYEGGGEAFNVRDPYEGTQFYIVARLPQAGD